MKPTLRALWRNFIAEPLSFISNASLWLIAYLLLTCGSCTTFNKAKRKFARTVADTTYQTITTTVPRDSVVLRLRTDTTHVIERVRQGRATIVYERNGKTTYVKADCDSVVVIKKVPMTVEKQVWGVDPKYEQTATRWRTAFFIALALLLIGVAAYLLARVFTVNISRKQS